MANTNARAIGGAKKRIPIWNHSRIRLLTKFAGIIHAVAVNMFPSIAPILHSDSGAMHQPFSRTEYDLTQSIERSAAATSWCTQD